MSFITPIINLKSQKISWLIIKEGFFIIIFFIVLQFQEAILIIDSIMCIANENSLNIIGCWIINCGAWKHKICLFQTNKTTICFMLTAPTWTQNIIAIVLLLVRSRLTTTQICNDSDHTYNIKHINDWWGQTATSCPAPVHLSYLLMEVVEVTVAVLHSPLVLSICHLDDVDLINRQSGMSTCVS